MAFNFIIFALARIMGRCRWKLKHYEMEESLGLSPLFSPNASAAPPNSAGRSWRPITLALMKAARDDVGVSLVSLLLFAFNLHCEQFSDRVVSAMRLDDRGSLRMAFEEVFRRW